MSTGWQVTLCDPIWHVSSFSPFQTAILGYLLYFIVDVRAPADAARR